MPKTVILSTARTPIGKLGGGLASVDATELGGTAIEAALERAAVEPEQVQQVVMGHEASEVAAELEMTRADMDRWALRSHELALKGTDEGRLPEEIVPVPVKGKKGDTT